MKTLDLIFVTTGRHPETEALICRTTNSEYSHAAVRVEIEGKPKIIEAVRPALRIADGNCFDGCPALQVISLPITEEQRQAVVAKAFELVGKKYGVDDCIIGGLHDLCGDAIAGLASRLLDDPETWDCSATQIVLARAAYPDYAEGEDPATVTPEHARQLAMEYAGRLGVSL